MKIKEACDEIYEKVANRGYVITAEKTKEILYFANELCKERTGKPLFTEQITTFCGRYFLSTIDNFYRPTDFIVDRFNYSYKCKGNEFIDKAIKIRSRYKYKLFTKNSVSDVFWRLACEKQHRSDIKLKAGIYILMKNGKPCTSSPKGVEMRLYNKVEYNDYYAVGYCEEE